MSITYKELAWMINPAKLDDSEVGRVRGCPYGDWRRSIL